MASNLKYESCVIFLSSCLILMASFAQSSSLRGSISSLGSGSAISDLNLVNGAKKVTLDLYYETLCPFCAQFISQQLNTIFENGLIEIVTLQLVPWGNAILKPNKTFECQHGPSECLLNTVHACAIAFSPNVNDHFPFIKCVEKLASEGNYTQWKTCLKTLDLDPKIVPDCSSNGHGTKLELEYAGQTAALQPPHTYVPWVVVNGQPLYEDYGKFTSYICKAFEGALPSACKDHLSFDNAPKNK